MWSLRSLYCSAEEREKGAGGGAEGSWPGRWAPSLRDPENGVRIPRAVPTFVQIANGRLLLQKVAAELLVQAKRQHVVNEGTEEGQRCFWQGKGQAACASPHPPLPPHRALYQALG